MTDTDVTDDLDDELDQDDTDTDTDDTGDGDPVDPRVAQLEAELKKTQRALERARKRAKPEPTVDTPSADDTAKAAVERANTKILHTEARAALIAAGVDRAAAKRAVRLLDLVDVAVDDDGDVDEGELDYAIEQLRAELPQLFAAATSSDDDAPPPGKPKAKKVHAGRGDGSQPPKTIAERLVAQAGWG